MRLDFALMLALAAGVGSAQAQGSKVVKGLKSPATVAVGPGGKVYVTLIGELGRSGDGSIAIVEPSGKVTAFATGLDDPRGLVAVGGALYVADLKRIWRVDVRGKLAVYVDARAFPRPPGRLEEIASDGLGSLYVSDSGTGGGRGGAVYRVDARRKVIQVLDGELTSPQITRPGGLLVDDEEHLILADSGLGDLYRFDLISRNAQRIGGFGGANGLAQGVGGGLFVGNASEGRIYRFSSDIEPPILLSGAIRSPAGLVATPDGRWLVVADTKAGTVTWLPIR